MSFAAMVEKQAASPSSPALEVSTGPVREAEKHCTTSCLHSRGVRPARSASSSLQRAHQALAPASRGSLSMTGAHLQQLR